jgi:hypothetical protein
LERRRGIEFGEKVVALRYGEVDDSRYRPSNVVGERVETCDVRAKAARGVFDRLACRN